MVILFLVTTLGILGKKLFGLGLEYFPRRVGQDDVEAAARCMMSSNT
jgi:hypothetical protein